MNNLQSVEVYFHSGNQITAYTVSMRSIFTAQAVFQELQSLLPLSDSSRKLRLLELYHGEKFKVFSSNDIVQFQLYNKKGVTLHAERVPEFEEKLEDNERILQIFRIIRDNDCGLVRIASLLEQVIIS
ncbi:ubiquitin C-terminal hydrolase 13-like [Carex rostrata]